MGEFLKEYNNKTCSLKIIFILAVPLSIAILIAALSTTSWYIDKTDSLTINSRVGLFRYCQGKTCVSKFNERINKYFNWLPAVQAFLIIGLLLLITSEISFFGELGLPELKRQIRIFMTITIGASTFCLVLSWILYVALAMITFLDLKTNGGTLSLANDAVMEKRNDNTIKFIASIMPFGYGFYLAISATVITMMSSISTCCLACFSPPSDD